MAQNKVQCSSCLPLVPWKYSQIMVFYIRDTFPARYVFIIRPRIGEVISTFDNQQRTNERYQELMAETRISPLLIKGHHPHPWNGIRIEWCCVGVKRGAGEGREWKVMVLCLLSSSSLPLGSVDCLSFDRYFLRISLSLFLTQIPLAI